MSEPSRCLILLGSTGSIGRQALEVVRHLGGERVRVVGLAARSQIALLEEQIVEFRPQGVAVAEREIAEELALRYPGVHFFWGIQGLERLAGWEGNPIILNALSGTVGIFPTVAACLAGHDVALANKEALVSGGAYITGLAKKHGVKLLPVDSEHSAIFQCLQGIAEGEVSRLFLTASGGPLLHHSHEELDRVTVEEALRHPNWSMGAKITVDSSTWMNKGLEVIEAHWLFGVKPESIEVVVHPQSIVHSMVEMVDGSLLAQVGYPDMRLPIQHAITYPERLSGCTSRWDVRRPLTLQFLPPDSERFPCLGLAYRALQEGGSFPAFMNGANEVLVARFLRREISWKGIARGLQILMEGHSSVSVDGVEAIAAVDREARRLAEAVTV